MKFSALGHGLGAIQDDVQDSLFDQVGVHFSDHRAFRHMAGNTHVMGLELGRGEHENAGDDAAEVLFLELKLDWPREVDQRLDNPIEVPGALSFLAYGHFGSFVHGLNDFPKDAWPDNIELLYYSFHIMITLGTLFIALMGLATLQNWRGRLESNRLLLWVLMLAFPYPYIANTLGWMTAELGRQIRETFGLPGIANAWGMTEFPVATSPSLDAEPDVLDYTVGAPVPGVSVRVVDGELRLKGPQCFLGYADATLDADAFDDEGWLRTGDLGLIDAAHLRGKSRQQPFHEVKSGVAHLGAQRHNQPVALELASLGQVRGCG